MSLTGSKLRAVAETRSTTSIWLLAGVGALSVLLWNIPAVAYLLYPFKLFVTFLHEASHGLAAILTGGAIDRFVVNPDTSGLCYTRGGFRPLVVMGGYVGSCLWGGALLVASRRAGWEKAVLIGLAVFLLGFTVLYVRNFFGFGVGLGLGAFFLWAGWHGKNWQLALLLTFLAVQNSFYALSDLGTVISLAWGHRGIRTDATIMSQELTMGLVPPVFFAIGIAGMAIALFFIFLRIALKPEKALPEG